MTRSDRAGPSLRSCGASSSALGLGILVGVLFAGGSDGERWRDHRPTKPELASPVNRRAARSRRERCQSRRSRQRSTARPRSVDRCCRAGAASSPDRGSHPRPRRSGAPRRRCGSTPPRSCNRRSTGRARRQHRDRRRRVRRQVRRDGSGTGRADLPVRGAGRGARRWRGQTGTCCTSTACSTGASPASRCATARRA